MPRTTLASTNARIDALEAAIAALPKQIVDALVPAPAPTPAVAKPKSGKVQSPSAAFGGLTFDEFVEKRIATRKPCAIAAHAGTCNRTFGAGSSGDTNHTARID